MATRKSVSELIPNSLLSRIKGNAKGVQAFNANNYESWLAAQAKADNLEIKRRAEIEQKARLISQLMKRSGVQDIYLTSSFENYFIYHDGQTEAVVKCRDYLANFGTFGSVRNMVFSGTTGTGKNHLASAICNGLIAMGRSAVVATAMEIQMRVRACRRSSSQMTEEEALRAFSDFDLLVLDEIELGSTQDHDSKIVNAVIDHRTVKRKPTIVLTNLAVEEFAAFVGDRINDRLCESIYLVQCYWPSYRTNKPTGK